MNSNEEGKEVKQEPQDARCFRCGAPTEIQMGDFWICERCCEVRSSCCSEFEEDPVEEDPPKP